MLLLKTKVTIPPKRPFLIPRQRLFDQLDGVLQARLVLLSAPAGFGKTTLVVDWLTKEQMASSKAIAWFSIDSSDDEPVRFWQYALTAVQQAIPELSNTALSLLQASQPPLVDTVLITWLNEITAVSTPILLVLDDYHAIGSNAIHQQIAFLLDNAPSNLHLIMTSRVDPPLALPRLRARGQLIELRASELRFLPQEAAQLLAEAVPIPLTTAQIDQLAAQTEGWAAGLHLAALSMQGAQDITAFLERFTGSHRYILNYLVDEVFEQQSADVQRFLLETAVLSQLTADLCQAVTQRPDSGEILAYLEEANVFILPLDDVGEWYRYHQLFADVLYQRLQTEFPELVAQLHRRAAHWFKAQGRYDTAVYHAVAGDDWETAVQIIVGQSHVAIGRGDATLLERWVEKLPTRYIDARPELSIAYAWIFVISSRPEAISPFILKAEAAMNQPDFKSMAPFSTNELHGQLAALKAQSAIITSEFDHAVALCQEALTYITAENPLIFGIIHFVKGVAERHHNQLEAAIASLTVAIEYGDVANHMALALAAANSLADLLEGQGKLTQAEAVLTHGIEMGRLPNGHLLPAAAFVLSPLAKVYRHWNRLDEALTAVNQTIELGKQAGIQGSVLDAIITRGLIHMSNGAFDQALADVEAARAFVPDLVDLSARIASFLARIHFAAGHDEKAIQIVASASFSAAFPNSEDTEIERLLLVRVYVAQRRHDEAFALLNDLQEALRQGGRLPRLIEALLLMGRLFKQMGDVKQETAVLIQALTIGQPEQIKQVFLDEGQAIVPMLKRCLSQIEPATVRAFAQEILTMLNQETAVVHEALLEPLKEREVALLQLISAGLSNREIADQLFLTEGTVKSYIHQLYSKLGVRRRTEAVDKARALHIIS